MLQMLIFKPQKTVFWVYFDSYAKLDLHQKTDTSRVRVAAHSEYLSKSTRPINHVKNTHKLVDQHLGRTPLAEAPLALGLNTALHLNDRCMVLPVFLSGRIQQCCCTMLSSTWEGEREM